MKNDLAGFKKFLDENTVWPAIYTFKFIVPEPGLSELTALIGSSGLSLRPSKNGKFIGVTLEMEMPSSDAIITIYQNVAQIEGLISL